MDIDIDYQLVETTFTVSGVVDLLVSQEYPEGRRSATNTTILQGVRGDESDQRELRFGSGGADDDFSVDLTPDHRLSSLSFKSVGAGGQVLSAAVTLAAFTVGVATQVAATGTHMAIAPDGPAGASDEDDDPPSQRREQDRREIAALDARYRAVAASATNELAAAREAAVAAADPVAQLAAMARARRLEQIREDARRELAEIVTLRGAWEAGQTTHSTETHTFALTVKDLPVHGGGAPDVDRLTEQSRCVWIELGVIIEVGPADEHRTRTAAVHDPQLGGPEIERSIVRWRVPRQVRLWIWRADKRGGVQLQSSAPALVLDELCDTKGMELRSRLFGEESGQVQFGDLGTPVRVVRGDKSTAGVVAASLGALPERIVSGLDSATKVSTALGGLRDAHDEKELAGAKRRLELARTELDEAGLAATSEQFIELKRLEQSVAIGDARGKLAPPSELDGLKSRLELVQTRTAVRAAERADAVDSELGDLRVRIALLEARIREAELASPPR